MLSKDILKYLEPHRGYLDVPAELEEDLKNNDVLMYINGCGSIHGITSGITELKVDGICIIAACIIHDFQYNRGQTISDKVNADLDFLHNVNTILRHDPSNYHINVERRQLRYNEALILFKFVHVYGFKAFSEGKEISTHRKPFLEELEDWVHVTFRTIFIPFDIAWSALRSKLKLTNNKD
jgi:hypothetical protein